ncbi:MAG TPA: hypothetical protein VHC18_20810 [Amycolatopsis sp.]|nr:hypothetical protein [Amycolatopsis sp.]
MPGGREDLLVRATTAAAQERERAPPRRTGIAWTIEEFSATL